MVLSMASDHDKLSMVNDDGLFAHIEYRHGR